MPAQDLSIKHGILRIVMIYAAFAAAWILFSDKLVAVVFTDTREMILASTIKGWLFVAATSLLLYGLMLRYARGTVETLLVHAPLRGGILGWPRWSLYALAVAASAATLWLQLQIAAEITDRPLLVILVFPIILSAMLGGAGPGLLATLCTALGVLWYGIAPTRSLAIAQERDLIQWLFLIVNGILVSALAAIMRSSHQQSAAAFSEKVRALSLLGAIAEASDDAIFAKDAEGRYLLFNRAAGEVVGKPVEAVVGRDDRAMFPPEQAAMFAEADRRILETGQTETNEEAIETATGRKFFLATKGPLRDASGAIFGVFGISRNITERKRTIDALRENEATLRALIENMQNGLAHCLMHYEDGKPVDFTYLGVNKAFETQTGLKNVVGRRVSEVIPGIRESDTELFEIYGRVARTGRPERFETYVAALRQWFSVSAYSPQQDQFVAVFDVTTERKRLEAARLNSQRMESLGTLAGGIAHDFNNILAAIRGNADLAAGDVAGNEAAAQSIAEIQKAGVRATELIRRIMTFGRPVESRQNLVDLANVVDEALKLLRPTLRANIVLARSFAAEVAPVLADEVQVHEAVVNLTTNAAYAIGRRPGRIEYALATLDVGGVDAAALGLDEGRYTRLTVSDDGVGMDEATKARIFDAFFTTKPIGEGTGLGLSMVHGIMRSHGGAVTVESTLGQGTSFHLYFPATRIDRDARAEPKTGENVSGMPKRVLYVDDEEALVFLAKRALAGFGHSVVGFTDPQAALEAFRADPNAFDVVVTDLSMPGMSGFELTRALFDVRPDVPVLVMTGYIRADDEVEARNTGVRSLLLKPSTMDELVQMLDRSFNGRLPDDSNSGTW